MKNIFIILFSLLLCLSISGCTGTASDGQESSDTTKATEVTEATDTTASLPDNVHTEYDGFYITLRSASEEFVSVTWHNNTDSENITFGEYYHVEIYKNGTWERVPCKADTEIIIRDIAYALPANGGQKKMSFSLSHLDMSEPGTYRVRCEFYDNGNKFSTWVEFEVPLK